MRETALTARRGPRVARRVGAVPAVQCVRPCAADQRIIPSQTIERVGPGATFQRIVARRARQSQV